MASEVEVPRPGWSVRQVANFFEKARPEVAESLEREAVDGEAFAKLSAGDLERHGLPRGPALKLVKQGKQRSREHAELLQYACLAPDSALAAHVPQYALLGARAAGKTTLVSRLTGLPCAQLQSTCRPFRFALVHDDSCISPAIEVDGECVMEQKLWEVLALKNEPHHVAVQVQVRSTQLTSLIIVDLPGLTVDSEEPQTMAFVRDPSITPVAVLDTMDEASLRPVCQLLEKAARPPKEVVVICNKADEGLAGSNGEWLQLSSWKSAFLAGWLSCKAGGNGNSGDSGGGDGEWRAQKEEILESFAQEEATIHESCQVLLGSIPLQPSLGLASFRERVHNDQAECLAEFVRSTPSVLAEALRHERATRETLAGTLKAELQSALIELCQSSAQAVQGDSDVSSCASTLEEDMDELLRQSEDLDQRRYNRQAKELLGGLRGDVASRVLQVLQSKGIDNKPRLGWASLQRIATVISHWCADELQQEVRLSLTAEFRENIVSRQEDSRSKVTEVFLKKSIVEKLFHPMVDIAWVCALQRMRACLFAPLRCDGTVELSRDRKLQEAGLFQEFEGAVNNALKETMEQMNAMMHEQLEGCSLHLSPAEKDSRPRCQWLEPTCQGSLNNGSAMGPGSHRGGGGALPSQPEQGRKGTRVTCLFSWSSWSVWWCVKRMKEQMQAKQLVGPESTSAAAVTNDRTRCPQQEESHAAATRREGGYGATEATDAPISSAQVQQQESHASAASDPTLCPKVTTHDNGEARQEGGYGATEATDAPISSAQAQQQESHAPAASDPTLCPKAKQDDGAPIQRKQGEMTSEERMEMEMQLEDFHQMLLRGLKAFVKKLEETLGTGVDRQLQEQIAVHVQAKVGQHAKGREQLLESICQAWKKASNDDATS